MLTEQRYELILKMLEEKSSITVNEVKELLNTSESTVRRDITALHNAKKLTKVFGGAVKLENIVNSYEPTVAQKLEVNEAEKRKIAQYAADLVVDGDFLYLDAGTTTGYMLESLKDKNITVVTNAVDHAKRLATMGIKVFLIGGELKGSTEAVVGSQAVQMIKKYHFTKAFLGTNGILFKAGFTTPDANEAIVKSVALEQSREIYILADYGKFDTISSVTFADFSKATILTDSVKETYKKYDNIVVI